MVGRVELPLRVDNVNHVPGAVAAVVAVAGPVVEEDMGAASESVTALR